MKHATRHTNLSAPANCRLREDEHEALEARAKELNMTISELVRKYVKYGLKEDAARESVFEILSDLKRELQETRRDHALMAEVLLSAAGKIPEKEAHAWARANIRAT